MSAFFAIFSAISCGYSARATEISENINARVFESTIREATSIREAQTNKTNVFDYDPKSKVAKDYDSFVDEFLKIK